MNNEQFVENVAGITNNCDALELNKYSLAPWSISKLKCLQKCPFQFFLKYILKVKLPPELAENQDTLLADVGSAAHRILELIVLGVEHTKAYQEAKKEFVPKKLTDVEWVAHVETLEMSILSFKERMEKMQRAYPIKRVLTELKIGVTKDWEATGFFANDVYFRGIIDLVIQLENGDGIIIDHKTGGGEGSIRPYEQQLNSYKPLFHKGVAQVSGVQAGVHFIKAQDVKMGEYSPVGDIEGKIVSDLEWTLEGAVERVKELGFFKHIRGPHCRYCEFDGAGCKAALLKPVELSTKKFFEIKRE